MALSGIFKRDLEEAGVNIRNLRSENAVPLVTG